MSFHNSKNSVIIEMKVQQIFYYMDKNLTL